MWLLKYSLVLLHVVFILGQDIEAQKAIEKQNATDIIQDPSPNVTTTSATPNVTTSTTFRPPTTTALPTTTTALSTTTEPATTTAPAKYWEVLGESGTVCILAKMGIQLDLTLNSTHSQMKVPESAAASGSCGEDEQILVLTWDNNNNSLTLNFKANETLKKYYIHSVNMELRADNDTLKLSEGNITLFETSLNFSYECSYSDPLKVTQDMNTVKLSFSDIKLVAFKKDNSTEFANVSACPPDTPDIVPIVVGCALTFLVVVVLIAYLVSRRRTQTRGYLSM